tara:strand:+ start:94 stop:2286 length:2193 start_codon:yes stop_codon:yes gene_type:complete
MPFPKLLSTLALSSVLCQQLYAQEALLTTVSVNSKSVVISHTETPPLIDGIIDDEVWTNATFIDDLHQVNPVEYAAPSEPTEIYMLYDADAIYVAVRLFINPEDLTDNILRRTGNVINDDNIVINVDPFNNQRSGYYFGVNANGVRVDGIFQNVTQPDNDWDSIFFVETSRFEGGWIAEFAIPFRSLSFDPNSSTWGLNFTRSIQSKNELIAWQSYNRRFDPSSYGELRGLNNINQGLGLDIIPSFSMSSARRFSPDNTEDNFEPSLDMVYKITSSLNGSLTINTDFSSAEVDNRQVNLTRFNLFFPEKRDFFLRESDIFQFGRIGASNALGGGQNGRPFFSRNIGLGSSGESVDLNYGAKVSGRIGKLDIGALSIRQDAQAAVDASTLSVVRANMGLVGESTLGFIMTDGNPRSNLDNSLYGVDYLYRNSGLSGGRSLEASGWYQASDTEGLSDNDSAAGAGFALTNNTGFNGGLAVKRFESNFNPALGFANRKNVDDYSVQSGYSHRFSSGYFQTYDFRLTGRRYNAIGAGLESQSILFQPFSISNRSGDRLLWISKYNKEVLAAPFEISPGVVIPAGEYHFSDDGFTFSTAGFREWSGSFSYIHGSFYSGNFDRSWADITWKPSARFSTTLEYDVQLVDLPEGKFTTRIISGAIDYIFFNNLSWTNLIQYDNVSETLGINMRLHWVPEEGQEFYFVINQLMEDYDRDNKFQSEFTDFTIKFSYTFRY